MKILFASSLDNIYVDKALEFLSGCPEVECIYLNHISQKIHFPKEYDLGISFLYHHRIPKTELHRTWINFHPGPLPEYGGRNVAYHAIMNGETKFGGTIHYMDENFDTGDIIEVEKFPINETYNAGDLVYGSYQSLLNLFKKYIPKILKGEDIPRIQQKVSTYYKYKPLDEYIYVDEEAFTRIRALSVDNKFYPKFKIGTDEYSIVRDNSNRQS